MDNIAADDEEKERLSGDEQKEISSANSSSPDYQGITYNAAIEKTIVKRDPKNPSQFVCCCGCPFQVVMIIMFVLTIV